MTGFNTIDNVMIEQDRKKAIHWSLQAMTSKDVLLIAGKGHEMYQEIQGQRLVFSDKQCVLSFYQSLHALSDGDN
jgi:UDP-N-acetylmuramoyl-L-alanyl-D-glutamate--2,6-diaminopimelate ligase